MSSPLYIKKIEQVDNFSFLIQWNDDVLSSYRLADLQKKCPCAACREHPVSVDDFVRAKRIVSVGRYALKIEFTQGCTQGIYDYFALRHGKWK